MPQPLDPKLDPLVLLNRQIHALEDELRQRPKPQCRAEWISRFRLEAKIRHLRGERDQMPLFPRGQTLEDDIA